MRTLRCPLLATSLYHAAVVTIDIMLYTIALVLIYLITGNLYLLTTFLQFPLSTSGNHKSDLFFYEFVLLLFQNPHISDII